MLVKRTRTASTLGWILTVSLGGAAVATTTSACGGAVSSTSETSATSTSASSNAADLAEDRDTCSSGAAISIPAPFCDATAASDTDSVDQGLFALGTTRCAMGFNAADLGLSMFDVVRLRGGLDYRGLHAQPMAIPAYGSSWRGALATIAGGGSPVTQALALAAGRRGDMVDVCLSNWTPAEKDASPLASAIAELGAGAGDVADVAAAGYPDEFQRAVAPVVHALAEANRAVSAVRDADAEWVHAFSTLPTWIGGIRHFELNADSVAALGSIDIAAIERAGIRLSATVEHADLARFAGRNIPSLTVATPMGAVIFRGTGSDSYGPEANGALMVLDTGGDDLYKSAIAASSEARPVSIAIDLAGSDTYTYDEAKVPLDAIGARLPSDGAGRFTDGRTLSTTPRQGAGTFGIGYLFDLGGGNDTYRSLMGSQGAGALGVGALYDAGGNDTYTSETFSQGAAAFGIGLLLDAGGDDKAVLYNSGQGFGFSAGVGVLFDVSGNDDYFANPGDPSIGGDRLYGSDQLPGAPTSTITGNMSMAQGVGAGHRPDWPDAGYAFAGGIGVLADLAGNDSYRAGVWAQGTGFVAGVGMLLDGAGNDQYDALYYGQGAAAHMGIGLHADDSGDDRYDRRFPAVNAMLGIGEDFATGVHIDRAGDDSYRAPDTSMGAGTGNGIGIAVNIGGGDSFSATGGLVFGAAGAPEDMSRAQIPAYGLFVKVAGTSYYETHSPGDTWGSVIGAGSDLPVLRGYGADRPKGTTEL